MTLQARVDAAIDAALGSRIVGCVVLISQQGQPAYARAAGLADREAERRMQRDAIFRLASITKPIVTTAALRMADLGLMSLDDPVAKYLPYFTPEAPDGSRADIRIRQLMTHTSGLGYNVPADVAGGLSGPLMPLTENLRRLARQRLNFTPGTAWEYGMSIDVLGGVIAAINGTTLAETVARYVTGPLGMADTAFGVTDRARLVPHYMDGRPPQRMADLQAVPGEDGSLTLFDSTRIFQPEAPQSGGAGMAGTADDVLALLEAVHTARILRPATRDAALSNQIGDLPRRDKDAGKRFGLLGAVTEDPAAAQFPVPVGTVDWGGAWGHNWIIAPASQTSIVTLTNTLWEGCNGPFREEIAAAVFG
jgi:CubicO group peptidase (beta-lactamase class C family)